jgi:hypothetical protein
LDGRAAARRARGAAPRVEAAGIAVEPSGDGFVVRDPWRIATAFVALPEAG